ncbi:MAG: hypothetical protein GY818_14465, partial [Planctomycetaceae bacterium]|nr:hypothetical protein [Planctomycetaceae bacterium]
PSNLRKCVGKALKTRKDDRYQTALELRQAIQESSSNRKIELPPTIELGAGECPKCHTRNDAGRKFCNSCGASLRVGCLKCELEIPAWDKFCPECGSDQHVILNDKIAGFNQQLVRAEEFLANYAFEESRNIVDPVAALADTRFEEVVGRASKLQSTIEARRKQEFQTAENKFEEAKQHMVAFDYESAIRVLSSVPDAIKKQAVAHDATLEAYYDGLVAEKEELDSLLKKIKKRVKYRNLNGLLDQVNRAIELSPNREHLLKIQSKLRLAEVKQQMVGLVKKIKTNDAIDDSEVVKLFALTQRYLTSKPNDETIQKLEKNLWGRLSKTGHFSGDLIQLNEIKFLTVASADYLANCLSYALQLDGLEKLTDSAAHSLSQFAGQALSLNGLLGLTDSAAANLSQFNGDLYLRNLVDFSEVAHQSLRNHFYNLYKFELYSQYLDTPLKDPDWRKVKEQLGRLGKGEEGDFVGLSSRSVTPCFIQVMNVGDDPSILEIRSGGAHKHCIGLNMQNIELGFQAFLEGQDKFDLFMKKFNFRDV